jgi:hypothetical protein
MSKAQINYGAGKTTQNVANELEVKYGIVGKFYELEEDNIVEMIEDAFGDELDQIMQMQKISRKGISDKYTDKIVDSFQKSLMSRRFDGILPNVPTKASLRGVSHLRINPNAGRGSRPSFVNTGMYLRSFRAWVTE